MFKNYFKTAWRYFIKSRFYSALNVLGLATGIAFTLLIGSYIWTQLQVNGDLRNPDRQYIIQSKWKNAHEGYDFTTLGPLAKALKEHYPTLVANYYRYDGVSTNVSSGKEHFREELQIGDSTLLGMFGFHLLYGNAATALNQPFSVVISKAKAIKYFGSTDVVGKTMTIENFSGGRHGFRITGVIEKVTKSSVTQLTDAAPNAIFVSVANLDFFGRNMEWRNRHIAAFIELQQGVDPGQLIIPMKELIKQNAAPEVAADLIPELTSLKLFYLNANNGLVRKMLYALSAIAVFILAMAIINFMNMSVSRSRERMREIGVRKVLGGLKKQLLFQFLTESVIVVFIATILALLLFSMGSTFFSGLLNSTIPSFSQFPACFIGILIVFILFVGVLAGLYPALILSSFKSVDSLKGKSVPLKGSLFFRKSLIVFQIVTALVAFTGAIIISKQIDFFLNDNLGYDKNDILSAQLPRNWTKEGVDKMETIRNEFSRMREVKEVSLSFDIPDGNNSNEIPLFRFGRDSTQSVVTSILENDERFLSAYKIRLLAGAPFRGNRQDSLNVLLNETAVKALGWKDAKDALGQLVKIPGNPAVYSIGGVTGDFHFGSMQNRIAPVIMFNLQFDFIYRYLSFKINKKNPGASVAAIQKKWNQLMPGAPFEYQFMSDRLTSMYQSEIQLKKASYTATLLALIIVLLGTAGLIALSIRERFKEMGIRKVLGASVPEIIGLFIKEFLLLILIGSLIACPCAYMVMEYWLQGYAYRIHISYQPFIISVMCLGLITLMLICLQTIRTAVTNPVKSLRSE